MSDISKINKKEDSKKIEDFLNTSKVKPTAFLPQVFLSLTMPYRDPKTQVYDKVNKKNGDILRFQSLINTNTEKEIFYGIPYGGYARLIWYFILNEAIIKKSKKISFGNTINEAFKKLGLYQGKNISGNKLNIFKNQWLRITNCVVSLTTQNKDSSVREQMLFAKRVENWNQQKNEEEYSMTLSEDFFEYLSTTNSTPFSFELVKGFVKNPMKIDLYILINQLCYYANKQGEKFISFKDLYNNFGSSSSFKSFKQTVKLNIIELLKEPALITFWSIDFKNDGITILPSSHSHIEYKEGNLIDYIAQQSS